MYRVRVRDHGKVCRYRNAIYAMWGRSHSGDLPHTQVKFHEVVLSLDNFFVHSVSYFSVVISDHDLDLGRGEI